VLLTLEPGQTMTVEKYLDMRDELSAMFGGREVDLVQKRLLKNPFRRHEILTTREVLYAA
jgi:predicted nucleotidyltransferase